MTAPANPITVLCVLAHPDDVDFSCGGTVAQLTKDGNRVVYCLVTSGQAGGSDPSISREQMAQTRQREQTEAAAVLGVTDVHFLDFSDGSVEPNLELRKAISRVIRQVKPDRVITHSPLRALDQMYASHPDHLATGEATMNAVYPDARNQFAFPDLLADEGLQPHTVPEVWITTGVHADTFSDITEHFDLKLQALMCHQSQLPNPEELESNMRGWGAHNASVGGLDEGVLAESFRVLNTA